MYLPEESIADTVIRLRMVDISRATVRSIEIVKSRGHGFQMGRHTFRILDGQGIQVYRRVQAPRKASRDRASAFDPTTRITTGIPGLDEKVNGGYFLGSTTVVAGISGVGKSVMGVQFLAEGARRGERSLMLTLDEQVPQVLRNARSLGIDFQPDIDRGLVRLQYDPPQEIEVEPHELLLDVVRDQLGLTGAKRSCDVQVCGACTLLVDGRPVSACTTLAFEVRGKSVLTIEGLADDGKLHPLQEAFIEHGGFQCGFCTPGMILAALELLRDNADPSEAEIRAGLSGNLCMCTGYVNIVRAVRAAAKEIKTA